MMVPTIHLNGTSRDSLLEQVTDAGHALHDAMKKLDETAPNGRDYYPQGQGALKQAETEYRSRAERLRSVYQELQLLAMEIADAGR